ncbi:MAG: DMT family transporter [Actinobacteria bacterium]|nr:DMT family transporter [Actinomycetota bacterium]
MRSRWAERLAPIAFVLVWSTGFIGARYGLPYAPPFTLLAIRLSLAAAALALLALVTRSSWPRKRVAYERSTIIGILLHTCYLGGVFVSIDHGLPVAVSALIVCLQPVCVAALAGPLLGERLMPRQWTGIALGLMGALIVLEPGLGSTGDSAYQPIAVAAAIIALIASTIATLLQKKWGGGIAMLPGTAVQYAAATVVLVVLAAAFDHRPVDWTPQLIGALIWMVFALSIGAVLLMFWLLRRGTASGFSSLYFLVPPVTLVMGFVLFGQTLPPLALVGFAISSLGVLLVRESR